MLEGAVSLMFLSALLPALAAYDAIALGLIAGRGLISMGELTAGWLLASKSPPGARLAQAALVASAVLAVFEVGLRLAPGNLDPAWRWWFVGGYCVYATAWTWWLRKLLP